MLPTKIQALLDRKPKLLGAVTEYQHQKVQQKQQIGGLNLGLDKYFNGSQNLRFVPIPIQQSTLKISKLNATLQDPIDSKLVIGKAILTEKTNFVKETDIKIADFHDLIPDKRQPLHTLINFKDPDSQTQNEDEEEVDQITYLVEEEKTKKFLIDALTAELSRLDQHSQKLEDFMGENQQMVERLRSQNQDIEKQVKQMVRERENEDRIRKLEDGMNLDGMLRLKLDENMDQQRFNEELRLFYEDNEKLFTYADQLMADCGIEYLQEEANPLMQLSQSLDEDFKNYHVTSKRNPSLLLQLPMKQSVSQHTSEESRERITSVQKIPQQPSQEMVRKRGLQRSGTMTIKSKKVPRQKSQRDLQNSNSSQSKTSG